MLDESFPRYRGLHRTVRIVLAITFAGLLGIIGASLVRVLNPELFAAILQKVVTITMDVTRTLLRLWSLASRLSPRMVPGRRIRPIRAGTCGMDSDAKANCRNLALSHHLSRPGWATWAAAIFAWFRMVIGYWDMAASLVTSDAIDADAFRAAHGEIFATFSKIQPFLSELRSATKEPDLCKHMEAVVMGAPDAEAILTRRREAIRAAAKERASIASAKQI
jgi:hypothetical protein